MNSLAFTPAATYLTDDRAAQAYIRLHRTVSDLEALQADFKASTRTETETQTVINLGYVTVIKTATGWLVNNLPAVGFVAVQAYILARYW